MTNKHRIHINKNKNTTTFNNLAKITVEKLITNVDKTRPRIGDKCKLNIKRITGRKEWVNLNPKYKKFVLSNVDTIFTVQEDKLKPKTDGFVVTVALAEDTTEPKWLWCVDDLIKVDN